MCYPYFYQPTLPLAVSAIDECGRKLCYHPSAITDAMANVEKLSIALTPDMVAELRAAVEGGDDGSVSEVIRDALRHWRLRRKIETLETEELRRLVQEGIDSEPGQEADAVFARLRARLAGHRPGEDTPAGTPLAAHPGRPGRDRRV